MQFITIRFWGKYLGCPKMVILVVKISCDNSGISVSEYLCVCQSFTPLNITVIFIVIYVLYIMTSVKHCSTTTMNPRHL